MRFAIALLFATTLLACVNKGELIADVSGNIPLKGNTAFKAYEDLSSPKFVALREKYRIDTALRGEADEFQDSCCCGTGFEVSSGSVTLKQYTRERITRS